MRRADPEDEALIPRISPIYFTNENSSRELDDAHGQMAINDFSDGWNVVGWALSCDVAPRDLCLYVILCEREDGYRVWCHGSNYTIERMADIIRKDPSRVVRSDGS